MAIDDNGTRAVEHRPRPRRRPARRRLRSRPAPAWRSSRSTRDASQPGVAGSPTPAPARSSGSTAAGVRQRPRRGRRHLGRQRRRRGLVVRRRPACAAPPARSLGRKPGSTNFLAWWDGDPVRELLDRHPHRQVRHRRRHPAADRHPASHSNNGTKATPALSGDLFGDWREEVIWRDQRQHGAAHLLARRTRPTGASPRCCTTRSTGWRIAWQNTAYNQPPHPSFFIGNGMANPPAPNVRTP